MSLSNETQVVNWEVHAQLHDLICQLAAVEQRSWMDSMSDNFYHTNGGYAASRRDISALESRIKDLCPAIDLNKTRMLNMPHWYPLWESVEVFPREGQPDGIRANQATH